MVRYRIVRRQRAGVDHWSVEEWKRCILMPWRWKWEPYWPAWPGDHGSLFKSEVDARAWIEERRAPVITTYTEV